MQHIKCSIGSLEKCTSYQLKNTNISNIVIYIKDLSQGYKTIKRLSFDCRSAGWAMHFNIIGRGHGKSATDQPFRRKLTAGCPIFFFN